MKTLKKIHLKSVSEFLSDQEMKLVVGGGYKSGYNLGTCGVNVTCGNGIRVDAIRGMSIGYAKSQQAEFYKDPDAIAYYMDACYAAGSSSVNAFWCCDSCN